LKGVPLHSITGKNLKDILQVALDFGKKINDKSLEMNSSRALEYLTRLEKIQVVSREDGYASILRAVALEVLHRSQRRQQQKKEIQKLRETLQKLRHHAKLMKQKLSDFETYLEACRENIARQYKPNAKPMKFSYKDLAKQGVIVDSDVPEASRSKMKFFISMPIIGQFLIEAKLSSVSVRKMQIDLEDLLEMKDQNEYELELDHITLHIERTVVFMNQYFLHH